MILLQADECSKPLKVKFNERLAYYEEGALRRAGPNIRPGDNLRIKKVDIIEAKKLAEGHGGWSDKRKSLLGITGKVERITDSGCVRVFGMDWNRAGVSS